MSGRRMSGTSRRSSQTLFELRFSLGNEGNFCKNLNIPDLAWNSLDVILPDIRDLPREGSCATGSAGPKLRKKLEKAGTVDFKKHPAWKVGTRSRQCGPKVAGRFAFPGAPKS